MTIYDQVSPNTSLDEESDRLQSADTERKSYQNGSLIIGEMRQARGTRYDAAYKSVGLGAYVINICRHAARPAVMLRAALIIVWFVLLALTSVSVMWVYALRQIGAAP